MPAVMGTIDQLFPTKMYRAHLRGKAIDALNGDLVRASLALAGDDAAGQAWSAAHHYRGYTSYASLDDLTWRSPEFADLKEHLDAHAKAFGKDLEYDLGGTPLVLDSLWVNVLEPGGAHAAHIHPHSVLSGTYYVAVPDGAAAIRFEDPRHGFMMSAPPRKAKAKRDNQTFVSIAPKPGLVLMWESFLRHEVVLNDSDGPRISVSFNYGWGER